MPPELRVMEHMIKLNPLNVTGNEDWLRSQGQWHWILILLHGLTLSEPGLFGSSTLYAWMEWGGPWTSHETEYPDYP